MDQNNSQNQIPILNQANTSTNADVKNVITDIIGVVQLSESPDSIYHYFVASPMYAGFGDLSSPERTYFLQDVNQMSPTLKNYLTSTDTVETIFSLGKEFDLEDGQISDLGVLVREFLTGKIFIKDFPNSISSKFGIDDIKAGNIANRLISKSFAAIIEDVKRIQRNKFPDRIAQLQKDNQSQTLNQPTAKPAIPRQVPTPAQQIQQNIPQVPPARPQNLPQITPQSPQPGSRTSDSGFTAPRQTSEVSLPGTPQSMRPPPQMPPRPPVPAFSTPPQPSRPEIKPNSPQSQPSRNEFKIPDINFQNDPNEKKLTSAEDAKINPSAQKSLEAELEKVANVIDLRTGPKNQSGSE